MSDCRRCGEVYCKCFEVPRERMAVVALTLAVAFCVACNPIKSAAEADYEAEQLACVHDNATRAAADACRAVVKARWAADSAPDVAITETIADGGAQ